MGTAFLTFEIHGQKWLEQPSQAIHGGKCWPWSNKGTDVLHPRGKICTAVLGAGTLWDIGRWGCGEEGMWGPGDAGMWGRRECEEGRASL